MSYSPPVDLNARVPKKWKPYFCASELAEVSRKLATIAQSLADPDELRPQPSQVFRPLDLTDPGSFSVVLLGQDPYPKREDIPTGVPFSVCPKVPIQEIPASLAIIFWELVSDLRNGGSPQGCPRSGDLSPWLEGGRVFMWNAAPTGEVGAPGEHLRLWKDVTKRLLETITAERKVVFVCWGKQAKGCLPPRQPGRHRLVYSGHPNPYVAFTGRDRFVGSRPFTRAISAAKNLRICPPDWRLPT